MQADIVLFWKERSRMLFVSIFLSLPNLVQEEKITKILSVITIILSHIEFFFFNFDVSMVRFKSLAH